MPQQVISALEEMKEGKTSPGQSHTNSWSLKNKVCEGREERGEESSGGKKGVRGRRGGRELGGLGAGRIGRGRHNTAGGILYGALPNVAPLNPKHTCYKHNEEPT